MSDITLYREESGEGFPLILLHGNGEDHRYFKNQIAPLSSIRRVISFDTRGHGKSPRGVAEFSLDTFADDLKDELDRMEIKQCDILGFSDGGNIALLFALKHPDMVRRLILNGADLYPSGVKLTVQIPIVAGWLILGIIKIFDKKAVPKFEMMNLMVTQPHISPNALANIKAPTLVITGTRDMIRDSHSKKIADSIPNCKKAVINGSHFIAAENPKAFNKEVIAFLNTD